MTTFNFENFKLAFTKKLQDTSSSALEWVSLVLIHSAFIPTIISAGIGITDKMPSADIVMFVWAGLFLNYIQAIIKRNVLIIATHGIGFFIQAVLLVMVVFK